MSEVTRENFLTTIWDVCSTLSDEAISKAQETIAASGFDADRGLIPLSESSTNLISARSIVQDAIEKQKLINLPITVQRELVASLELIKKTLFGMIRGEDEVVNFVNGVETLNTAIWKYGFYNLSEEVLGYQRKLNQLKNQQTYLSNAKREIDSAQADLLEIGRSRQQLEELIKQSTAAASAASTNAKLIEVLVASIQDSELAVAATKNRVDATHAEFSAILDQTKTSAETIKASEAAIKEFLSDIEEHSGQMQESTALVKKTSSDLLTQTTIATADMKKEVAEAVTAGSEQLAEGIESSKVELAELLTVAKTKVETYGTDLKIRADQTIEEHNRGIVALREELAEMKESVREQIAQATGLGLFGAFQSRQNSIAKSKRTWVIAMAVLVVLSISVTLYIAHYAREGDLHSVAFWIKLSITLPLWAALTFCILQYNRERRLEEEYAFKASVSVSLEPYRELIYRILEKDGNIEGEHYSNFVIESVKNIFTSPMERVFQSESKERLTSKMLKETAEIIGTVVKAAK